MCANVSASVPRSRPSTSKQMGRSLAKPVWAMSSSTLTLTNSASQKGSVQINSSSTKSQATNTAIVNNAEFYHYIMEQSLYKYNFNNINY